MVFREQSEFLIYLHDKGEEYYLHYDFWPSVPFIHRSTKKEYFSDVVVRKELETYHENCQKKSYDYFGNFIPHINLHIKIKNFDVFKSKSCHYV